VRRIQPAFHSTKPFYRPRNSRTRREGTRRVRIV
jgi:hypothetical protein